MEIAMHAEAMMSTHPEVHGDVDKALIRCIETCMDCAQVCLSCADACLSEEMVAKLRQCIRLNLDCADLCSTVVKLMSRRTGSNDFILKHLVDVCAEACGICADECQKHADRHEHCRVCAETCTQCLRACRDASAEVLLPRQ
jgi:hypothetical protein